jgi:hypothetical protein
MLDLILVKEFSLIKELITYQYVQCTDNDVNVYG